MLFRETNSGLLYQIHIPAEQEDVFLELQSKGKLKYIKVSPEKLPKTSLRIKLYYKRNKNGKITFDLDRIKPEFTKSINQQAKRHILNILKRQDWGNSYEECLAELNSSAQVTETKILYLLKPYKSDLTITDIRQKVADYLVGKYTAEDVKTEMKNAGLKDEEVEKYLSLLGYAVEVAKLLYWVEEVWDYVEQKEKEINQAATIEELEQIEIKFPELK